jgi:hypothetical protein
MKSSKKYCTTVDRIQYLIVAAEIDLQNEKERKKERERERERFSP